jgi:hypothetical protein
MAGRAALSFLGLLALAPAVAGCPHPAPEDGGPVELYSGGHSPNVIAVDEQRVYWTTIASPDSLMYGVKSPSSTDVATAVLTQNIRWFALGGDTVYWSEWTTSASEGRVMQASLAASGTAVEVRAGLRLADPRGVVLAGNDLFVACAGDGTVVRVPLDGSQETSFASGLRGPTEMIADDQALYFVDNADGSNGDLYRAPLSGGGMLTKLAGGIAQGSLALFGGKLYFAGGGAVQVVAADGSSQPIPVPHTDGSLGAVAVDASGVYFTEHSHVELRHVPLAGGDFAVVAAGEPAGIALDATAVFWTDGQGDRVMKLAK